MDRNLLRLQVAQDLVQSLVPLIPPSAHGAAQAAFDAAAVRLKTIDGLVPPAAPPPPAPLVVPQLVPATSTP